MKSYCLYCLVPMIASLGATVRAEPPRIEFQPKNQSVVLYQQAAFGVIASGTGPLAYQWRKDGVPIPGATADQIVLDQSRFSDGGRYSVIVSNTEGTVTSSEVVLTVTPPKAGDLDSSFLWGGSVDGPVRSVVLQPDGKILIGGDFSTVHGTVRRGVARLNADGSTDYTLNGPSKIDGLINSVALQSDGKVIIAGNFWEVDGLSHTGVARLNADGTLDAGFQAELSRADSEVLSVALQSDGKVFIGGQFTTVNRVRRPNFARLNSDGTFDFGFRCEVSGGRIRALALQSDGKLLIGGDFSTVNGVSRAGLARLHTDGSLDDGFLNVLAGGVNCISVQRDGKVLIGGSFTEVNGESRRGLARLKADGSLDSSFGDGLASVGIAEGVAQINSVVAQGDGKILIAGAVSYEDEPGKYVSVSHVARLNTDGTLDTTFQNGFFSYGQKIHSVAVQPDGKVLIGRSSPGGHVEPIAIQRLRFLFRVYLELCHLL